MSYTCVICKVFTHELYLKIIIFTLYLHYYVTLMLLYVIWLDLIIIHCKECYTIFNCI